MNRTIQKQNIQDRERFAANIDNKGRLIRAAGAIVIGVTAILVWSASTTAGACLALASNPFWTRIEGLIGLSVISLRLCRRTHHPRVGSPCTQRHPAT